MPLQLLLAASARRPLHPPLPLLYTKLVLTVSKVTIFIKNSYSNASCIFIKLIFLKRCVRAHTHTHTHAWLESGWREHSLWTWKTRLGLSITGKLRCFYSMICKMGRMASISGIIACMQE